MNNTVPPQHTIPPERLSPEDLNQEIFPGDPAFQEVMKILESDTINTTLKDIRSRSLMLALIHGEPSNAFSPTELDPWLSIEEGFQTTTTSNPAQQNPFTTEPRQKRIDTSDFNWDIPQKEDQTILYTPKAHLTSLYTIHNLYCLQGELATIADTEELIQKSEQAIQNKIQNFQIKLLIKLHLESGIQKLIQSLLPKRETESLLTQILNQVYEQVINTQTKQKIQKAINEKQFTYVCRYFLHLLDKIPSNNQYSKFVQKKIQELFQIHDQESIINLGTLIASNKYGDILNLLRKQGHTNQNLALQSYNSNIKQYVTQQSTISENSSIEAIFYEITHLPANFKLRKHLYQEMIKTFQLAENTSTEQLNQILACIKQQNLQTAYRALGSISKDPEIETYNENLNKRKSYTMFESQYQEYADILPTVQAGFPMLFIVKEPNSFTNDITPPLEKLIQYAKIKEQTIQFYFPDGIPLGHWSLLLMFKDQGYNNLEIYINNKHCQNPFSYFDQTNIRTISSETSIESGKSYRLSFAEFLTKYNNGDTSLPIEIPYQKFIDAGIIHGIEQDSLPKLIGDLGVINDDPYLRQILKTDSLNKPPTIF